MVRVPHVAGESLVVLFLLLIFLLIFILLCGCAYGCDDSDDCVEVTFGESVC